MNERATCRMDPVVAGGGLAAITLFHFWVNLFLFPKHAIPDEEEFGFLLSSMNMAQQLQTEPLHACVSF
jgi:hypothetical protein